MEDNPTVKGEGKTESQGTRGGRSHLNLIYKSRADFSFDVDADCYCFQLYFI